MTVPVATARVAYAGAGSAGPFSITFYFLANSHIKAVKLSTLSVETILTLTTHYTLTGAGDEAGGALTLVTALAVGETLTITRNVPITQETDWPVADPFPAASHEDAADKITMIVQQINDAVGRTVRQPISDASTIAELPVAASRANKVMTFDAAGNPLMGTASAISFTPTTEAFNGTGAQVAYTLSGAPSTASALIVRIDGVVQTPITDFTVSGTTLTFTTAPATGTGNIVVQNFGIAAVVDTVGVDNVTGLSASTGASKVGFAQSGSGAIAEAVSVALQRLPHSAQYSSVANFNTARNALTGTQGLAPYVQIGHTTGLPGSWGRGTNVFSGTNDEVVTFGYNVSANGASIPSAAEASVAVIYESNYNDGATRYAEWHVNMAGLGQTYVRPFAANYALSGANLNKIVRVDINSHVDIVLSSPNLHHEAPATAVVGAKFHLTSLDTGGKDFSLLSTGTEGLGLGAGKFLIVNTTDGKYVLVADSNNNVGLGGATGFGTNAAGVVAVKNNVAPTTGPADTVQFYSSDNSAGHTIPSFFCEGTEVIATGQADSASSVRVKLRINGTVVTLLGI